MARMRLMAADATGTSRLVCPYCGAEKDFKPPYEVQYCDCRDARRPGAVHGERMVRAA